MYFRANVNEIVELYNKEALMPTNNNKTTVS